ncbi:SGNH/GDSL hydrolase family protein [Aeromicrobium sp.]|uniref:SGNH/GDSL hydrolase family protein n=1 Tax=Aeromicrobium sp. TaxID=1871063 RepID=UPI00199D7AF0|nr:SGNH/GDSL hydrolase family protein [Aeromicrobium sp.]MBC7633866.1 SGNH/GDSL hydrolase family protein [Aeromicrobium sp.]
MGWVAVCRSSTVVVMLVVLASCSSRPAPASVAPRDASTPSATSSASPSPSPLALDLPTIDSYTSIGDSFASGPALGKIRDDSGFCLRSDHNWASILATTLGTRTVDDVSCAGATTADVLSSHTVPGMVVPAQLDAVRATTDLVTVQIGGNDGGLFSSLVSACAQGSGTCSTFADDTAPAILRVSTDRVARVLDAVHTKAPKARVLVVGYLRILPDTGTCKAVQISASDARAAASAEVGLDSALASAARSGRAEYVSLRALSKGHDACAGDNAWTNGATVADGEGIAYHPRLAGMAAVAQAVAQHLSTTPR